MVITSTTASVSSPVLTGFCSLVDSLLASFCLVSKGFLRTFQSYENLLFDKTVPKVSTSASGSRASIRVVAVFSLDRPEFTERGGETP